MIEKFDVILQLIENASSEMQSEASINVFKPSNSICGEACVPRHPLSPPHRRKN